jgi:AraC-like DNA-binding protein
MIVASLVWESTAKARLMDATRGAAHLRQCERQSEVLALVRSGLADVVVTDLADGTGSALLMVRTLKEQYPSVPVVLYCALTPATSREMLEFAKAGVDELVVRGVDDVRLTLQATLSDAAARRSALAIYAEIDPLVPPNVGMMIKYALEHGRRALSVESVAQAMNVHRKTLVHRLNAAGLPSPREIIAWCRLIITAKLLEDPGRKVEQVALLLDFPSGNSMRNMIKRYTGLRANEVRQNGGAKCVLHAFKRALTAPDELRQVAS